MQDLLTSRKFYATAIGELMLFFRAPPFDQIPATQAAWLVVTLGCAFIIGTAIQAAAENFGSKSTRP